MKSMSSLQLPLTLRCSGLDATISVCEVNENFWCVG